MVTSLITNNGKKILLDRTYKVSPTYLAPTRFRIGQGQTGTSTSTTSLTRQVPFAGTEAVDSCDATTGWSAGTDSAVATYSTTKKEGTNSLSIAKTGTAGTVFSISKTTTSRDYTSKDLHTWLYITALSDLVASGTAIVIRFGSDNSNYYYKNIDISALSAGWNLIVFSSAEATGTTGSPVIASCDYYEIRLNVDAAGDTVAANRCLLDDLKLASSDDYYKTFVATYPSVDETNLEVTTRCLVLASEANGYLINGLAIENADSSPLFLSVDEFIGESKTNTDELIFTVKDRVV